MGVGRDVQRTRARRGRAAADLHQRIRLNASWPILAAAWYRMGYDWAGIIHHLGLDRVAEHDQVTHQLDEA